ncbi:MAG: hypothetical protein ACAI35_24050 [Candidatus Methylacidiphilales bacterium]|nr:hypothetical protein [Candidatus Methylacidiphilales bacterium]
MKIATIIWTAFTSALLLASTTTAFPQAAGTPAQAPASPSPVARDPQISIFGIGSSAAGSKTHPQWMPQMVAIGILDCRSTYGGWGVQKVEGQFDFKALDERLAYDESLGVKNGMTFYGVPPWKQGKEKGLPMESLPELSQHIFETVKYTKGRISHFEVWNEPPNGTSKDQTAADYAKMVCTIYDAAKKANPDAQVGFAAKSAHLNYLDQALVAGAKGHFDYITLHPYEILGCIVNRPGTEPVYLSIVPNVRKMLAARDPSKVNAPVFFTEIGFDSRRGVDKQAQAVLKTYIMGIHQGVACINLYEGMDGDSGPLGLLDAKAQPRPAYHALGRLIETVGRHPSSIGWVMFNEKHYGFMIQGARGPVLATWAGTTAPDTVDFGQEVDILDPVTGTVTKASSCKLTAVPVLITRVPEKLIALAKENKTKPLPWGGDYSKAKSVSVTYVDKYEEKGLHTMAADSIAADVLAYGGNARSGEVPKGGTVFYIDPNFLSYDTVPIEVTVMVKRADATKPISLGFEYESTKAVREGYSKVAPQVIPEDTTQWHKLTWKIDDSQFVGTWAFHFRLQGDAKKYLIHSVTVTRLDR